MEVKPPIQARSTILPDSTISESVRSRVWLEIDLHALRSNFESIARHVNPLRVMAVLKANAYGLGVSEIARTLADAGIASAGMAEVREALALREFGLPVHILGELLAEEAEMVVKSDIVAPIGNFDIARVLSAEAVRQKKTITCQYLIDTGMGRLGIPVDRAVRVINQAHRLPGLRCNGIYTHFPVAYQDNEFSDIQIDRFVQLLNELASSGITFSEIHVANSDGINNIPRALKPPFTTVRTGINLYGAFDLEGRRSLRVQPVLSLKTRLIAARQLPAGSTLGYGRLYTLPCAARIGTISIGYADGLPLALSNQGHVMVRGCRCPIRGRVSMDYTTIDLSPCPEAQVGDEVTCLGDGIRIADWAAAKGTIPYDIICSIGNRVERRYVERPDDGRCNR